MDEGSCIIYGATGRGEAPCALPLLLAPCAIPCPFSEQTEEVLAPDPTSSQGRDLISQDYAPRGVVTTGGERC